MNLIKLFFFLSAQLPLGNTRLVLAELSSICLISLGNEVQRKGRMEPHGIFGLLLFTSRSESQFWEPYNTGGGVGEEVEVVILGPDFLRQKVLKRNYQAFSNFRGKL